MHRLHFQEYDIITFQGSRPTKNIIDSFVVDCKDVKKKYYKIGEFLD